MTTYAKLISETSVQYPTAEEFRGVVNWKAHDSALRRKGYAPITNIPDAPEGKTVSLDMFELDAKTRTKTEPRPYIVEDFDPETGEKTGEHTEWRDTEITVDDSEIIVKEYHYEDIPEPVHTVAEYDAALEAYLLEVRTERGYTSRDPSEYYNSSNERWAQDARDWLDFRDRVMAYGLEVENQYESTGTAPCTLEEFKTHLRTIECHWTYEVA